jgi:hypothetical protein
VSLAVLQTGRIVCSPCSSPPALPYSPSAASYRSAPFVTPCPIENHLDLLRRAQGKSTQQRKFFFALLTIGEPEYRLTPHHRGFLPLLPPRLSICGSMQNDASLRRHAAAIALSILYTRRLCMPAGRRSRSSFGFNSLLDTPSRRPRDPRPRRGLCIGRRCNELRHDA